MNVCLRGVPAEGAPRKSYERAAAAGQRLDACLSRTCSPIFTMEPVRFDSFRFWILRKLIGSVRFGSEQYFARFDAVRPAFFGRVVARSGSVRFVSASGSGRFQNSTALFGSVRPVRFGFLFLPVFFSRKLVDPKDTNDDGTLFGFGLILLIPAS